MFSLKRPVKSNCQAALFDGVLSLARLSVKDNRCHQTQIWGLTFSLQRRTFQLWLKSGHVWDVIKNISKPLFDRQQIWVRPVWKIQLSQQCRTLFWQSRKFPGPGVCVWIIMAFTHMRILPQGERRTSKARTECPNAPFPAGHSPLRRCSRRTLGGGRIDGRLHLKKKKKKKAEGKKNLLHKTRYRKWSCWNYMW